MEIIDAAQAVWNVAQKKGSLYVTQPETHSDALIGFFVPAHVMAELASAIGQNRIQRPMIASLPEPPEPLPQLRLMDLDDSEMFWEADFWIGLSIGLFIALVVSLVWWWQL